MKTLPTLAGILAAMLLISCTDSSTGSTKIENGPFSISMNETHQIVGRGDGFLLFNKDVCREGVYSVVPDTGYYQISNGTLLTWDSKDCQAGVFTGTSQVVNGSWANQNTTAEIPVGAQLGCEEDSIRYFAEIKGTMTITETNVISAGTVSICMVEAMMAIGGEKFRKMGLEADGCRQFKWAQGGDTAIYRITSMDASMKQVTMELNFNGSACTLSSLPEVAPSAEACTYSWNKFVNEADPDEEWDEEDFMGNPGDEALSQAFGECVQKSGFGQSKRAALLKRGLVKNALAIKKLLGN